jgi:TusA-related sulfurtransferase
LSVGFPVHGHAVQFEAVADQPIAGFFRDPALQFLDLVVVEFDDLAALDVDQVIMMLVRRFFVARAAVAEVVLGENAGFLKESHRPINRRNGNIRIYCRRAPMHRLDVGMVVGFGQDACDHSPLVRHLETALGAQQFQLRFAIRHATTPYTGRRSGYSCGVMTIPSDHAIDITGEVCPMTFVRTKLKLERMQPGEVLSVRLRGEEPLRNVPRAAREEGHTILGIEDDGEAHIVTIRRA